MTNMFSAILSLSSHILPFILLCCPVQVPLQTFCLLKWLFPFTLRGIPERNFNAQPISVKTILQGPNDLDGEVAQVVEHILCKCEVPGLIPSTSWNPNPTKCALSTPQCHHDKHTQKERTNMYTQFDPWLPLASHRDFSVPAVWAEGSLEEESAEEMG